MWSKKRIGRETISLDGKSLEDAIKLIELDHGRNVYFPVNMSPYEFIEYGEHNPEEAQKMLSKVRDLGFKLSEEEEAIWEGRIREFSE